MVCIIIKYKYLNAIEIFSLFKFNLFSAVFSMLFVVNFEKVFKNVWVTRQCRIKLWLVSLFEMIGL